MLEQRQTELKVLERDTTRLERCKPPFPRVSYDEAATILKEKGLPFEWGGDFGAPDETALSENSTTARSACTATRRRSRPST